MVNKNKQKIYDVIKEEVNELENEHEEQVVTLRCPKCRKVFIQTDWEGCYKCDFKWGDPV